MVSETVAVRVDDALHRRLPPICVMTGAPAAGYVPIEVGHTTAGALFRFAVSRTRARYRLMLPMSAAAFDRWYSARVRRVWLGYMGLLALPAAAVTRWMGAISWVFVGLSVFSIISALVAHLKVPWTQPSASVDLRGEWATLTGVHERFAISLKR